MKLRSICKSVFCIIISLIIALSLCSCQKVKLMKLYVKDYGIVPNDITYTSENTKKINKLVKKAEKGQLIIFGEGTYYFDGAIEVADKEVFSVSGTYTKIVNTAYDSKSSDTSLSQIFKIKNCDQLFINSFTLSYYRYNSFCASISKHNYSNNYTYLHPYDEFNSDTKVTVSGDEPISSCYMENEHGLLTPYNALDIIKEQNAGYYVEKIIGETSRSVCYEFSSNAAPVISVEDSNNVEFEDVNIKESAGTAFEIKNSSNTKIAKSTFSVTENKDNAVLSIKNVINADNVSGDTVVSECDFNGISGNAVTVNGSGNVTVESCSFSNIASNGLAISNTSFNIINCGFSYISKSAISAANTAENSQVSNCKFDVIGKSIISADASGNISTSNITASAPIYTNEPYELNDTEITETDNTIATKATETTK